MFKDLNRPEGLYGDVYDKQTGAKYRSNNIGRPVVALREDVDLINLMEELNEKIK